MRVSGELTCWGKTVNRMDNFPTGERFKQISLNDSTGCGVTTIGGLACWGIDTWNDFEPRDYYDDTPTGGGFTQVSASSNTVCALNVDQEVTY